MAELRPEKQDSSVEVGAASASMITLAAAALLASFGVTMLLFSMAYARDVQTILRAPELIWDFICGRPDPGGPALPLMLTLGTLALIGSAAVMVWTRLRRKA